MKYRYTLEINVEKEVFCGTEEECLRCAIVDLADEFDGVNQNFGVRCEDEYCINKNDKHIKACFHVKI